MPVFHRAFALLALCATLPGHAGELLLTNGRLWTGDPARPQASAMLVRDDRIVAVGADAAVMAKAAKNAQRIDLKGRRVVPGINDAHTHITVGLPSINLGFAPGSGGSAAVRAAIAAQPRFGDRWITADVDMDALHDPALRRAGLDALQPERPVVLTGWTGHGMLVNTAAQRALALSLDNVPPGGWLGRDATGAFDGRVYEYAQWSPRVRLPARPQRLREVIAEDSMTLLKLGITSIQNMAIGTSLPDFIAAWQDVGTPLRVRMIRTPLALQPGAVPDDLDLTMRESTVTVSGTKWILDGTPIERGAAMRSAYPDGSHGRMNFSQREIEALLREIVVRGDQPLLHVSGDATLATLFDAMRSVATAEAWRALRPRIEHGDGLTPDLVQRARDLGMVLVQNPSHFMLPPADSALMQAHALQPLASVLKGGIPLALGSDGPPSPWLNMEFAVAPVSRPDEALTREQVLQAYTSGSAYAEFAEDDKGRLAPGQLADFAVLSQDVLDETDVPTQALPGTASLLTVIGGEIAWRDPAF